MVSLIICFRDERELLLNHGFNIFKEYLDADLVDPVEKKELHKILDTLRNEGKLYTSSLCKMKKDKIVINYDKLWEHMLTGKTQRCQMDGPVWSKGVEVAQREELRKKIAQQEIDAHPDNYKNTENSDDVSTEENGLRWITQDTEKHMVNMLKNPIMTRFEKVRRKSNDGLSALTSLLSALTNTPITVESIASNASSDMFVVKTSSDEPIAPGMLMVQKNDSDVEANKGVLPEKQSCPEQRAQIEEIPPPLVDNPSVKEPIKTKEEKEQKPGMDIKKPVTATPMQSTKPMQDKVSASPKKGNASNTKGTKKRDPSQYKPVKENSISDQKEKIKNLLKNDVESTLMEALLQGIKNKGKAIENGTNEDGLMKMTKVKCFGCSQTAADLYKDGLPKTYIGKANQQMAYPRVCSNCFAETQNFFCSKKCLSWEDNGHLRDCDTHQAVKNKSFLEKLNL